MSAMPQTAPEGPPSQTPPAIAVAISGALTMLIRKVTRACPNPYSTTAGPDARAAHIEKMDIGNSTVRAPFQVSPSYAWPTPVGSRRRTHQALVAELVADPKLAAAAAADACGRIEHGVGGREPPLRR